MASVKNKEELHLVGLRRWGIGLEYTTQMQPLDAAACLGKN